MRNLPWILVVLAGSATAGSFPEALTRPLAGTVTKDKAWSWPAPTQFEAAWQKRATASHRLVWGKVTYRQESGETLWLDERKGGTRRLIPVLPRRQSDHHTDTVWDAPLEENDVLAVNHRGQPATIQVFARFEPMPVPDEFRADWTYVATLTEAAGASAASLKAYAENVPMGSCSMDTAPQDFARDQAEGCFTRGELACFLQLQVRIMGGQFARTAWSSFGDRAHETQSARLATTGIDVDRFFRGLVVQLPGDRASELQTGRLGRALAEAGRTVKFDAELRRLAEDEHLDPLNRIRATAAWASMQLEGKRTIEDVEKQLATLKLHPLAREWWKRYRR